jgi:UDP-N-acetyl-D-mannosaminuronate dehydrogenase
MEAIARRPHEIVTQIAEALSAGGRGIRDARLLIVGVAYKPNVRDTRGSPAIEILAELTELGAHVDYHDPFVTSVGLDRNRVLLSVTEPDASVYDLVLVNTLHQGVDYGWLTRARLLLDPSDRDHGELITPDAEREAISVDADAGSDEAVRRVAEERTAYTIRR